MARLMVRAFSQDGKIAMTNAMAKSFLRLGFGQVNGEKAEKYLGEFLQPLIDGSELPKIYDRMAKSYLASDDKERGSKQSLKQKCEEIKKTIGDLEKFENNEKVESLLSPVVEPLINYLSGSKESIESSQLPTKLLEFMIELDKELVAWHEKSSKKEAESLKNGNVQLADHEKVPSPETLKEMRKFTLVAILGVKGLDSRLSINLYKKMVGEGVQNQDTTGTVLKLFNQYLARVYSKKTEKFIESILTVTHAQVEAIKARQAREKNRVILENARNEAKSESGKVRRTLQKSETVKTRPTQKGTEDTNTPVSPRSRPVGLKKVDTQSTRQRLAFEDENEMQADKFLEKFDNVKAYPKVGERFRKMIQNQFSDQLKSPTESELSNLMVNALEEEIKTAKEKINIIRDPAERKKQEAILKNLNTLMGSVLIDLDVNSFDS